jgi:hypothetical protein
MKTKLFLTIVLLLGIYLSSFAQDTLAAWTFPTGTATDANPNVHTSLNASVAITAQGGTSAIDFTKNGLTTKSAQATAWDAGTNTKYWQIEVNTTAYSSLTLYSKQTAGGANPGPRDWKTQYKVGASGTWTDIPGTNLTAANNWTTGVLNNISIPAACNNQPSVFIRWIMTSDTSVSAPALVAATGVTKIDDIYVLGTSSASVDENSNPLISVFPNPSKGLFSVSSTRPIEELKVYSVIGKLVYNSKVSTPNQNIDISGVESGMYLIRYKISGTDHLQTRKILIQ